MIAKRFSRLNENIMKTPKIVFISAMTRVAWGGSEALWHGAALRLGDMGCDIGVCVKGRPQLAQPILDLRESNVPLCLHQPVGIFGDTFRRLRERAFSRWSRHAHVRSWLLGQDPDLVCVSGGNFKDGLWAIEILEEFRIPFVIIVQANVEWLWPSDEERERLIKVYKQAKAIYCVSQGNLDLLEAQLACSFPQAEVVRNPFNLEWEQPETWPESDIPLNLACVGRLEPDAKGQDLIIHTLAKSEWRDREVHVTFYGKGASEQGLRALVSKYGLDGKLSFSGHVSDIREIWLNNHVLLMPSRYEGLPLALVEAMLCGRPALVTDVAGHCELVDDGVEGWVAGAANQRLWDIGMERLWEHRSELRMMGHAARLRARKEIPDNPCAVFADKLEKLLQ